MCPTTCLRLVLSSLDACEFEAAHDYAVDLLDWLNRGGFTPPGFDRDDVRRICDGAVCRYRAELLSEWDMVCC